MQQQPDTIFIQNLPISVTEDDLIRHFSSIGMIKVFMEFVLNVDPMRRLFLSLVWFGLDNNWWNGVHGGMCLMSLSSVIH